MWNKSQVFLSLQKTWILMFSGVMVLKVFDKPDQDLPFYPWIESHVPTWFHQHQQHTHLHTHTYNATELVKVPSVIISAHLPVRLTVPEPIIFSYLCTVYFSESILRHFFSSACLVHGGTRVIGRCECEKVLLEKAYLDQFQGCIMGRAGAGGGEAHLCGNLGALWAERPALSGHLWERGRAVHLPQVRGSAGERSHYEERWALCPPPPAPSLGFSLGFSPTNLSREMCLFLSLHSYNCFFPF